MSQFEELLAELHAEQENQSALAKAIPAAEDGEDDAAIQAAAEEGAEADEENPEDLEEELEDDGAPLVKSMTIDGEEVQVVDADAMIKSLTDLTGRVEQNESVLAKALESTLGTVKSMGEMIKSMSARIDKLSSQGAGRKTVLTVHEPSSTLAKSDQPEGLELKDVLAKAQAAFDAKKISGLELTTIDVALRQGQLPDQGLLTKALS